MSVKLYDSRGISHDLARGAFDMQSIIKPQTASLLLAQHMAEPFQISFDKLMSSYHYDLAHSEKQMSAKFWGTYVKPNLKKFGTLVWELGKPLAVEALATMAGAHPAIAVLIASAEAVLSEFLGSVVGKVTDQEHSLTLNRGQWVFIEKHKSMKRRMMAMKGQKDIKTAEPGPKPKVVSLGFYTGPAYGDPNRVNVFNMDKGSVDEVNVRQIRSVGTEIQSRADSDAVLSIVREIYFYKQAGEEFHQRHPKEPLYAGRNVICKGKHYTLIHRDLKNALIQDAKGNTIVVPVSELSRGEGYSTTGKGDDMFETAGETIHQGQWALVRARKDVALTYSADVELAIVYRILPDGEIEVFCALDGDSDVVPEDDVHPFDGDVQLLYSAEPSFKQFKKAAIMGDYNATKRFKLGPDFLLLCLGDETETIKVLTSEEPEFDSPKKTKVIRETVGNDDKDQVDARHKADVKQTYDFLEPDEEYYVEESGGGDGDDMLVGAIAVAALVLIGFGGAAAAV